MYWPSGFVFSSTHPLTWPNILSAAPQVSQSQLTTLSHSTGNWSQHAPIFHWFLHLPFCFFVILHTVLPCSPSVPDSLLSLLIWSRRYTQGHCWDFLLFLSKMWHQTRCLMTRTPPESGLHHPSLGFGVHPGATPPSTQPLQPLGTVRWFLATPRYTSQNVIFCKITHDNDSLWRVTINDVFQL